MTLADRAESFVQTFPQWPAAWPRVVQEQGRDVLYATWVLGNDYRTRSTLYGAYPHGYLPRVMALFPDAPKGNILHVFSGSLPASPDYVRCDSHREADLSCSVYDLGVTHCVGYQFPLVLADPPYSAADAEQYGTPMVDRRRAMQALARVTQPGGHLAWLDCVWPIHSKRDWLTVGRILVQRSTNHRVRVLSIFERVS